MYFVMYFSILVGDTVPKDTPVWMYYLLLQQILDILFYKSVTHKMINQLELVIEAHHQAYLKLFRALKSKTHNMLNYEHSIMSI